jgi:hypothetical protein
MLSARDIERAVFLQTSGGDIALRSVAAIACHGFPECTTAYAERPKAG